jgi:Zn-dependent peptidase ImmA (M78 family)/transcriptional regulator with XRE-family HTH domain
MSVTQEELGRRIKAAREACRMTQDEVGRQLGLSRSTVAQMELGNRAINSLELDRLAYLFGRDIKDFLADEFHEEDAMVALFRAHPEVANQEQVVEALRHCLALGREVTNLERLLDIHREVVMGAQYSVPQPNSKWDSVKQGERIAEEERRRLGLGIVPIANVAEVLETQGVRTALVDLPDDISGMTLSEPNVGLFVVINRGHHFLRWRFSYAHEYAHVLFDRERSGTVSRTEDRDQLIEVRANAFAANFLMPEEGVQQFIAALGKGQRSRSNLNVFDEKGVSEVLSRAEPASQDIQIYDVVHLAHHFSVSRLAALYRLRNLRFITDAELGHLKKLEDQGIGSELARLLDLPEPDHVAARNEFRHRFLNLGLEALRRGEITRAKLTELGEMVELGAEDVQRLLRDSGLDDDDEGDVLIADG